ncbi:acyltransferase family protein [Cellulomonas edaphi]|uniref:Acyltransferase family protein n=1 Tax=Cellulomonas edaphi TaxID=3053468 RepID=A0ABT7S9Y7_9CELL|nr:acyltransferase family protein [Cellulomons edaphi]MDM7831769.1 acyltransferase family protein [Cellulomons edaphi]
MPYTPQTAAPSVRRDPFWDNAKAVLVTLVVVGHTLAPLAPHSAAADVVYRWIYQFHMPAFVFVTGILTAELTRARAGRLVTGLVVPYVIFQSVQWLEVSLVQGSWAHWQLLTPRWTLWYLVAVLLWRLAAPLFEAMRPAAALALALVVAVAAGLGAGVGGVLALDYTLGLLPFFVAGVLLRGANVPRLLAGPRARAAGIVVLVAAAGVAVVLHGHLPRLALRQGSAEELDTSDLRAAIIRVAVLGLAAACVAAVLAVLPRQRHWWTSIGEASLFVYLLHPLVLVPWRLGDLPDRVDTAWQVALVILAAATLAYLLSRRVTRAATAFAVEPRWAGRLLRRPGVPVG